MPGTPGAAAQDVGIRLAGEPVRDEAEGVIDTARGGAGKNNNPRSGETGGRAFLRGPGHFGPGSVERPR